MRSRLLALVLLLGSSSALALACNVEANPPATPATAPPPAAPVTTIVLDAGAPVAAPAPTTLPVVAPPVSVASVDAGGLVTTTSPVAGGPDLTSCASASDCVTTPKNDCCHNGYLEAVNKGSVDAYHAAAPKCDPRRKCPMFRILDKRVADCNAGKCVLVQPAAGATSPSTP